MTSPNLLIIHDVSHNYCEWESKELVSILLRVILVPVVYEEGWTKLFWLLYSYYFVCVLNFVQFWSIILYILAQIFFPHWNRWYCLHVQYFCEGNKTKGDRNLINHQITIKSASKGGATWIRAYFNCLSLFDKQGWQEPFANFFWLSPNYHKHRLLY